MIININFTKKNFCVNSIQFYFRNPNENKKTFIPKYKTRETQMPKFTIQDKNYDASSLIVNLSPKQINWLIEQLIADKKKLIRRERN